MGNATQRARPLWEMQPGEKQGVHLVSVILGLAAGAVPSAVDCEQGSVPCSLRAPTGDYTILSKYSITEA